MFWMTLKEWKTEQNCQNKIQERKMQSFALNQNNINKDKGIGWMRLS